MPSTPVTMPVKDPIVASPVAELLHVPPATVLLSVVVKPTHIVFVPVIAAGD